VAANSPALSLRLFDSAQGPRRSSPDPREATVGPHVGGWATGGGPLWEDYIFAVRACSLSLAQTICASSLHFIAGDGLTVLLVLAVVAPASMIRDTVKGLYCTVDQALQRDLCMMTAGLLRE
jgi:hypothetical protein